MLSHSPTVIFFQKAEVLEKQYEQLESLLKKHANGLNYQLVNEPGQIKDSDAEILITPTHPKLPELIDALPELKWIHFLSAGVDPVWTMDFDKHRYMMTKSNGVHIHPMSEFALGAMLYWLKSFGTFQRRQQNKQWERHWLDEMTGKTAGILGLGRIGSELARKCKVLGMNVVGTVRNPREVEHVDTVYSFQETEKVLQQADFVTVLVPRTSETLNMLTYEELKNMRSGSVLINLSRGGVIEEQGLIKALKEGRPGFATLDVFDEEPLPADHPFWEMENVQLTPHVSGTTSHYMERAMSIFHENLQSLQKNGRAVTLVDVERGY